MNAATLIDALGLPEGAAVEQRVAKKLLVENGAPTAADKRHINDGVEELQWLAALKPTTIGVAEYRDSAREYLEIAVLRLTSRPGGKIGRLAELVHRAVPYPVLLLIVQGPVLTLSLSHKRWSQAEGGKTVLDGEVIEVRLDDQVPAELLSTFLDSLSLACQSRSTLYSLYQGWIDKALALQAARLTGVFANPTSAEHAAARRDALQACSRLETQIAGLRAAAAREKQIPRQADLNLELKRLEADYDAARARL